MLPLYNLPHTLGETKTVQDTPELDALRDKAQKRAINAWTYFGLSLPVFLMIIFIFIPVESGVAAFLGLVGLILLIAAITNFFTGLYFLGKLRTQVRLYTAEVQERYRIPIRNLLISLIGAGMLLFMWSFLLLL